MHARVTVFCFSVMLLEMDVCIFLSYVNLAYMSEQKPDREAEGQTDR